MKFVGLSKFKLERESRLSPCSKKEEEGEEEIWSHFQTLTAENWEDAFMIMTRLAKWIECCSYTLYIGCFSLRYT